MSEQLEEEQEPSKKKIWTSRFVSYLMCNKESKQKELQRAQPHQVIHDSVYQHDDADAVDWRMSELLEIKKQHEWKAAHQLHQQLSKTGDCWTLGHGPIEDFHRGLESFIGKPKKLLYEAMLEEHCDSADSNLEFCAENYGIFTTSKIEWNFVVDPSNRNLNQLGLTGSGWPVETKATDPSHKRKIRPLDDFEGDLVQINARLERLGLPRMTLVEVIALRLWSGPMGVKYNKMIRRYTAGHRKGQEWRIDAEKQLCLGNRYCTTIHVIQSTIAKLGKINPNGTGYTGLHGMLLHERFWTDHPDLNTKGGVEGGFMSLTASRDVAKHYACLEEKVGIILEVDMSTMDRGAELAWLAQYPHEEETLLPPLTYLHVDHICLDGDSMGDSDTPIMVVNARARMSQHIHVQMPLLSDKENTLMRQAILDKRGIASIGAGISANSVAHMKTNSELLSRFSDEKNHLVTGNPMESVLGLSYFLGVEDHKVQSAKIKGLEELEREILASGDEEVISNMKYVLHDVASERQYSNGIRDLNNSGKRLQDFVNHPIAKKYQLREEHVAALRIYTTSAFRSINGPLRRNQSVSVHEQEKAPHPFPVTVTLIDDAIKRLRASTANTFERKSQQSLSSSSNDLEENVHTYLWRGIKNTKISEDFLQGNKGGTELGLMSTTQDLKIAIEYSKSLEGNALLFKFKIDNIKQFGANIAWLSAFPTEEEILYPPLTFLQPTGRVETTTINGLAFTTVEIEPHL